MCECYLFFVFSFISFDESHKSIIYLFCADQILEYIGIFSCSAITFIRRYATFSFSGFDFFYHLDFSVNVVHCTCSLFIYGML